MKNLLLLVAVVGVALVAAPAQAQYFPGSVPGAGYGQGYGGYSSGYGYQNYGGYPGYSGYPAGGYGRGHIDYVPGGFVPHRGHFDYVAPHADLHIGGRRYEVQPGPFGTQVSPFPHRHR